MVGWSPCPGGLVVFLLHLSRLHSFSPSLYPCWPCLWLSLPQFVCHAVPATLQITLPAIRLHSQLLLFPMQEVMPLKNAIVLLLLRSIVCIPVIFWWSMSGAPPMSAARLSCSPTGPSSLPWTFCSATLVLLPPLFFQRHLSQCRNRQVTPGTNHAVWSVQWCLWLDPKGCCPGGLVLMLLHCHHLDCCFRHRWLIIASTVKFS